MNSTSEKTFDTGRKWGTGSIILQPSSASGGIWYLKVYAFVRGHKVRRKIRLGTVEELPTIKEAESAAKYVTTIGVESVVNLMNQRHKLRPGGADFSPEWFNEKLKRAELQMRHLPAHPEAACG